MRDGAHGHQRAHGHVARPEIRPRGPALEPVRQQRPDVVATEGDGTGHVVLGGLTDQLVEQRRELGALPGVRRRGGHQRVGQVGQRGGPLGHGTEAGERVEAALQAVEELGQAPGEIDVAAVHVVQRERGTEEALPFVGHRHPEQNPVESRPPGVGFDPLQLERTPVLGIEAPAHEGAVHPLFQPVQVVVAETEAAAHRVAPRQVEHLGGRDAGRGQLEHFGQDTHHRVRLPQRSVGEPDFERALRVGRFALLAAPAEGRLNQRCKGLNVGTHHDDVPRLQRWIILEQVEDDIAQDFDLSAPAVTRVHTDAVVVRREQWSPVSLAAGAPRRRAVGPDVVLQLLQQRGRVRTGRLGVALTVRDGRTDHQLHLASVAPPRLQERVPRRTQVGSWDRRTCA